MYYKTKKQLFSIYFEERVKIECLFGIFKIAKILKRARSTIKRGLDRKIINGKYSIKKAQALYSKRFITKHKNPEIIYPEFSKLFLRYFDKKWHGVETTWTRIKVGNPNIKIPH